jgi:hypothetical protein
MLRITENQESGTAVRLRLDGTISSESLADLAALCANHRVNGRMVIIDMAGVNFMAHEAACDLASLRGNHLRIINCSPFIAALLDAAKKTSS